MTYPPPPGAPDNDPKPSLKKDDAASSESTPGSDPYQQPYPGGQYPTEQYQNPYPGPQYGDQQYAPPPPGQPQYGTSPYGQGQYGTPSYGQQPYGQTPYGMPIVAQTNGKAIAALVCGIAAFLTCLLFVGIPAIILGNMATAEIEASGGTQDGGGMAQAGRVLGWVATGLLILGLVIVLIAIIIGASAS